MIIAQITDLHVVARDRLCYGLVPTNVQLAQAVSHLNSIDPRPDAVIASGDLTDHGRPDEYAMLRELLADLIPPVFVIPGNHDRRDALLNAFAGDMPPLDTQFVNYAIDRFPLRLIGLDTTVPEQDYGMMCEERLQWLDTTLGARPEAPTLSFMHHPPFRTGQVGRAHENHEQVDRDDFERQQVRGLGPLGRYAIGHSAHPARRTGFGHAQETQTELAHSGKGGVVFGRRGTEFERNRGEQHEQGRAERAADDPLGLGCAQRAQGAVGREHDAEHHQYERPTDVHDELRRPGELRAEQEIDEGNPDEREQEPDRHPHDVPGRDHADGGNRRCSGDDNEQNDG